MATLPELFAPADETDSTALLSPKQAKFVEEYLKDFNAAGAAKRAGYSPATAKFIGHENLTKPYLRAALTRRARALLATDDVTPAKVVGELVRIGFADIGDVADWGPDGVVLRACEDISEAARRAIAEIAATVSEHCDAEGNVTRRTNLKLKLHSKLSALEALGRYLKLFSHDRDDRATWEPSDELRTLLLKVQRLNPGRGLPPPPEHLRHVTPAPLPLDVVQPQGATDTHEALPDGPPAPPPIGWRGKVSEEDDEADEDDDLPPCNLPPPPPLNWRPSFGYNDRPQA